MAYDSDRHVVVLFGGQIGFNFGQGVLGDTWEYDGGSWTQVPITGPAPRTFVKMVYDSARQRMVLFGGYNGTTTVNDTWELVTTTTGIGNDGNDGGGTVVSAPGLRLDPNVPNPFHPRTVFSYQLHSTGPVRISIFDVTGSLVRRLVEREETAGAHVASWDGRDDRNAAVASGVYFYRLEAAGEVVARRMVLAP
jgi:hypothetical protein